MGYIYKITNNINGKSYIGRTNRDDPIKRWREHISEAKNFRDQSCNRSIYKAMRKYGIDNFKFSIIEEYNDVDGYEREKYYIDLYQTCIGGYNQTPGGAGRQRVDLTDQDVCEYYKTNGSVKHTAEYFQCDASTIHNILTRNNIHIISAQEQARRNNSKRVAQIDPESHEIIKIWDCLEDTRRKFNNPHVYEVCNGRRKTCAGYWWRYVD